MQSPVNSDEASRGGFFWEKAAFLVPEWMINCIVPKAQDRSNPIMGNDSVGNLSIRVPLQLFVFLKINKDVKECERKIHS